MQPVTISNTPLVFDALPAIKVSRYHGASRSGNIYTYGRMYILGQSLAFSLCAFEREPSSESRIEFAVSGAKGKLLLYSLTPESAQLELLDNQTSRPLPPPLPNYYKGNDEQGWYWGATSQLPAETLALADIQLGPEARFSAAVYKSQQGESAFGASFHPAVAADKLNPRKFEVFKAVPY